MGSRSRVVLPRQGAVTPAVLLQVDVDGSNLIESAEIRRLLTLLTPGSEHSGGVFEERVAAMMQRMDADGNGVVTCEVA